MRYMMLIYDNEASFENMSPETEATIYQEYTDFGNLLKERGLANEGEALQPTTTATTIQVREGKILSTDGPFAETKEQLGGYYILDCENLDEAIELAAKIPGAKTGSVEIRPIAVFA